jgi:hypothetical protein
MLEQIQRKDLQIAASVVFGTLAISTIATGLYLISTEYVDPKHFLIGLTAGALSATTMSTIACCYIKNGFFSQKSNNNTQNEKTITNIENSYLLNAIN